MEIVIEQRRWMDIVIEQWCALEDAKQKKARAGCRNHSSTTTASQPKKADIIQCAHVIFCWGSVRDTLARRMPYEMLVPRCKGILQRVNCHFIRALCAPSVSPCGSGGMVMDSYGHLHTVLSFPRNFVEGPLHGACLWVTPQWMATSWFVSVCLARCASFRCVL